MYMIKITGVLAVMIGVVGLLDSWKKTMDQRLSFLADFCRLYKSGRFYLAQQMNILQRYAGKFRKIL